MKISKNYLKVKARPILDKHVKILAEELGLGRGSVGHISFDDGSFEVKLKFTESADEYAQEAECYRQFAELVGCKVEWLGKQFLCAGEQFTLVGYRHKAAKYSILGRAPSGTMKVFTVDVLKRNFKDAAAA